MLTPMRGRRAVEVVVIARPLVQADRIDRVDAIAVLGHGSHADGTLSPETAYGLLHGVRLLERGAGRILILSGGTHRGTSTPDADAMAGVARALGIPAAAMMLDRRASSTVDHALAVAAIATGHRLGTVAVVTPPLRSRRAALAFRRAGVNALAAPGVSLDELPTALFVRRDDPLARLGVAADVLSEYLALAHYGLRGWL
jgi:uncharacterized SAM-binding protein YcdF (DUF218 family)